MLRNKETITARFDLPLKTNFIACLLSIIAISAFAQNEKKNALLIDPSGLYEQKIRLEYERNIAFNHSFAIRSGFNWRKRISLSESTIVNEYLQRAVDTTIYIILLPLPGGKEIFYLDGTTRLPFVQEYQPVYSLPIDLSYRKFFGGKNQKLKYYFECGFNVLIDYGLRTKDQYEILKDTTTIRLTGIPFIVGEYIETNTKHIRQIRTARPSLKLNLGSYIANGIRIKLKNNFRFDLRLETGIFFIGRKDIYATSFWRGYVRPTALIGYKF